MGFFEHFVMIKQSLHYELMSYKSYGSLRFIYAGGIMSKHLASPKLAIILEASGIEVIRSSENHLISLYFVVV